MPPRASSPCAAVTVTRPQQRLAEPSPAPVLEEKLEGLVLGRTGDSEPSAVIVGDSSSLH